MHEGRIFCSPSLSWSHNNVKTRVLPNGATDKWFSQDGKMIYSHTVPKSNEPAYDANNPIIRGGQPVEEKSI